MVKKFNDTDVERCTANDVHKIETIANMVSTLGNDMELTRGPCTLSILTKMDIFPVVKGLADQLGIASCYTVDEINLREEQKGFNLICLMFKCEFLTLFE